MNTVENLTGPSRSNLPSSSSARVLLRGVVALTLMACGDTKANSDARCDRRPPAGVDYGTCEMLLGAYYDPAREACLPVSGCNCDDDCQEAVPFSTIAECEETCTTVQRE